MNTATTRKVSEIDIGDRLRTNLGDTATLARSIENCGLLHPVVITPNNKLVVGRRRLAAYQHLGHEEIPVTVRDVDDLLRAQVAENADRKDFLPSEKYEIWKALEAEERADAKKRQGERRDIHPAKITGSSNGQVRDKIGALTGTSGVTIDRIVDVCKAAEEEPEKYGHLVAKMDETGKVHGAYKELKVTRQKEAIAKEPPPLPGRGPYRVIVVDPPWPYGSDPLYREGASPYPEMSIDDICATKVADIAHRDCILFLWTTNRFVTREAREVLEAWGFEYKTTLTWVKPRHNGLGVWLWGQTEHCLIATRGKPTFDIGNHTTLLQGPLRAHSQKPEEFYEFVEDYAPAPRYAELFQRTKRPNWDGHGDELANWCVRGGDYVSEARP